MHTLTWQGPATQSEEIEAQLNAAGALGIVISDSDDGSGDVQVQAWFDAKLDISMSGKYRWEAVNPDDCKITATVLVGEVEIECASDVFGDGRHPTTQLCLDLLKTVVDQSKNPAEISCLDIGTGSGILAIAAWQLGVRNILGIDNEPNAVMQARENAIKVGMPDDCFVLGDAKTFSSDPYSLVLANILTQTIEDSISTIRRNLAPCGILIVSGVGIQWKASTEQLFAEMNLDLLETRVHDGWVAFVCRG